ncbi:hypothetical protein N0V90_005781 [Kalmusia sp. IMI 367209]|nr:hypothetical protein N0V90_005781 [Kalmusia sp. IMI 367209]
MAPTIGSRDPPHIMTTTTQLPILAPRQPQLSQRPKLRLDTHQVRTFGKGSSLRLDTLSAVSPTARNTFSNAYEPPASAAQASGRPSKLRLSIDSSCKDPSTVSTPTSASTLSSALTSASADSATITTIPYKQPHNLRSILSNGPAPLTSRKMAPARPLFPAEKKVSFRLPLEEEIKTVKYTLAHSDIESNRDDAVNQHKVVFRSVLFSSSFFFFTIDPVAFRTLKFCILFTGKLASAEGSSSRRQTRLVRIRQRLLPRDARRWATETQERLEVDIRPTPI